MQQQQQQQQQQPSSGGAPVAAVPPWAFRLWALGRACLDALGAHGEAWQPVLSAPRGRRAASDNERAAAAAAELLLALAAPDTWERGCGGDAARGGALLAGALSFLARRAALFARLSQIAAARRRRWARRS